MDIVNPPVDYVSSPLTKGGKELVFTVINSPLTGGAKKEYVGCISSPLTKRGLPHHSIIKLIYPSTDKRKIE